MQFTYFANPMCSWCWGFSPVIERLQHEYGVDKIHLVLTPFRIDLTDPMDTTLRDYVLSQWNKAHMTTQQPFDFRFDVPKGFVYNTTPVCKAIKALSMQLPKKELTFVKSLQQAFYTKNQNITDETILIQIAKNFGLDHSQFRQDILGQQVVGMLMQDFALCEKLRVQSYPTLMIKNYDAYTTLTSGYISYDELISKIKVAQKC